MDRNIAELALNMGYSVDVQVNGDSMTPCLFSGDKVAICSETSYEIGDIVVFYYDWTNTVVIHRVIKIFSDLYWCRGDHSKDIQKVPKNDIMGRVFKIMRNPENFYFK